MNVLNKLESSERKRKTLPSPRPRSRKRENTPNQEVEKKRRGKRERHHMFKNRFVDLPTCGSRCFLFLLRLILALYSSSKTSVGGPDPSVITKQGRHTRPSDAGRHRAISNGNSMILLEYIGQGRQYLHYCCNTKVEPTEHRLAPRT